MKKIAALFLALAMIFALVACGGTTTTPSPTSSGASQTSQPTVSPSPTTNATPSPTASTTGTKPTIKFYGKVVEYTSGPKMCDELVSELSDKYDIQCIQVDWTNLDQVIRTGIASGDPADIYCYNGNQMGNFADMAVDLTPYLNADPTWAAQFPQGALDACTINGKIVGIPWEKNFSVILANKDMLDQLGITIPQSWTYDEFMAVCQKIQDAGTFPFANATDLGRANWLYRNAMLTATASDGTLSQYTSGQLSFTSPETTSALTAIKTLYDKNYMYPGAGAVTVKNDEVKAAFYQGKVAMMAEIAAGSAQTAQGANFNVVALPWPSVGDTGMVLGGYTVLFIPQNSKNIDAAVDVIKTFTNTTIQGLHAADGYIPVNVNVQVTDPFVKSVIAQSNTLAAAEFPSFTAMDDYTANNLMADLILNGGVNTVETQLEAIRQQWLTQASPAS